MQAGASAVVPETLEPSLQLASAVLSQLNMPPRDVHETREAVQIHKLLAQMRAGGRDSSCA